MKETNLTITINKLIQEVFDFCINPKNTPLWIDGILREETNEWPVKVGSIYRNQNMRNEWSEYVLTEFQPPKLFTMHKKDAHYTVRYTLKPIGDATELNYYEWMDVGELEEPFTLEILQKLKLAIEQSL
ncbi:MAG: SRPBCC family protein [Patescibacteria group bacterium]